MHEYPAVIRSEAGVSEAGYEHKMCSRQETGMPTEAGAV